MSPSTPMAEPPCLANSPVAAWAKLGNESASRATNSDESLLTGMTDDLGEARSVQTHSCATGTTINQTATSEHDPSVFTRGLAMIASHTTAGKGQACSNAKQPLQDPYLMCLLQGGSRGALPAPPSTSLPPAQQAASGLVLAPSPREAMPKVQSKPAAAEPLPNMVQLSLQQPAATVVPVPTVTPVPVAPPAARLCKQAQPAAKQQQQQKENAPAVGMQRLIGLEGFRRIRKTLLRQQDQFSQQLFALHCAVRRQQQQVANLEEPEAFQLALGHEFACASLSAPPELIVHAAVQPPAPQPPQQEPASSTQHLAQQTADAAAAQQQQQQLVLQQMMAVQMYAAQYGAMPAGHMHGGLVPAFAAAPVAYDPMTMWHQHHYGQVGSCGTAMQPAQLAAMQAYQQETQRMFGLQPLQQQPAPHRSSQTPLPAGPATPPARQAPGAFLVARPAAAVAQPAPAVSKSAQPSRWWQSMQSALAAQGSDLPLGLASAKAFYSSQPASSSRPPAALEAQPSVTKPLSAIRTPRACGAQKRELSDAVVPKKKRSRSFCSTPSPRNEHTGQNNGDLDRQGGPAAPAAAPWDGRTPVAAAGAGRANRSRRSADRPASSSCSKASTDRVKNCDRSAVRAPAKLTSAAGLAGILLSLSSGGC